jgi:hypothetical protein
MKRFVGERRAIAAAVLAFYSFIYLLLTFNPPPGWERAFAAMSAVYGLGFFGVVAGYFWARWYGIGLGISGVITTLVSLWQLGPEPVFLFWGLTHGAIALVLWGEGMSRPFDGREEWRAKFHMDEHAVHRLGRAVIRIGISLPYILIYALAPRGAHDLDGILVAGLTLGLAGAGTYGLLRLRTWSLAALAGAAGLLAVGTVQGGVAPAGVVGVNLASCAAVGAILLVAALAPFARPVREFLRGR